MHTYEAQLYDVFPLDAVELAKPDLASRGVVDAKLWSCHPPQPLHCPRDEWGRVGNAQLARKRET